MLDGWWPEACQHGVNGWAIGNGEEAAPNQDQRDLEALYATLEGDVLVREYFGRLYGWD